MFLCTGGIENVQKYLSEILGNGLRKFNFAEQDLQPVYVNSQNT